MKCVASDLTPGLFKFLDSVTKLSDVRVFFFLTDISRVKRSLF